ncbi:hypothetical protein D3C86_1264260 [compost metagenome]
MAVVVASDEDWLLWVAGAQRQSHRLEVAAVHGAGHGVAVLMQCGARGPAFADAKWLARDDDAQGRIAALDPAACQKAFATVAGNALQVDQFARHIQRHQQGVTTLAQAMRADAFGNQVRVGRISAARIAPPSLSTECCLELALLLLGFALALGLLDALTYFDCFAMVDRFTRAPGARPAILPTAKGARRNAVQVQDIPAVFTALSVAGNVEAMNHTARLW